jgi:hypothetical protein
MSPQTVNAYYNPSYNEVFPAAIYSRRFTTKADEAVNMVELVELLVTKSLMVLMIQDLVTMQMVT